MQFDYSVCLLSYRRSPETEEALDVFDERVDSFFHNIVKERILRHDFALGSWENRSNDDGSGPRGTTTQRRQKRCQRRCSGVTVAVRVSISSSSCDCH